MPRPFHAFQYESSLIFKGKATIQVILVQNDHSGHWVDPWAQTALKNSQLGIMIWVPCSLKAFCLSSRSKKKSVFPVWEVQSTDPQLSPGPSYQYGLPLVIFQTHLRLCSGGEGRVSQVVILPKEKPLKLMKLFWVLLQGFKEETAILSSQDLWSQWRGVPTTALCM